MPTVVEDNLLRRDSSRSGISLSEERAEKRSPSLIGMTVGSLQVTCSRLGISLRRPVVFNNGMGLLRRGGPHNGTSTYTASRHGGVPPISGQPQQNSQSGPLEQPQATTPHEERGRTDEMGLANLALRIKYRGERTRMIPVDRKRPVDTHIGQRLKEYRQLRGMTVRELADAADVTPGQISHYEHGRDRISHERITEFARILRIKPNDLYQPPGSRLRRNHVRWRLTNFMAAVIAEAAALMSSRRKAAADNEATMVAAVAVAVGASAAAASDAGAGGKSSLTTSADDTAVHIDASDAANALLIMDGANTDTINLPGDYTINAAESQGWGGKVAYDPPMSAAGEQASAQSTSAENGFIVSNPFPFTETASGNKDHSAFQFKPNVDHHATVDPGINLDSIPKHHLLQHPADNLLHIPAQPDHGVPAQPHHGADPAHHHVDGNQSANADDGNAHHGAVPSDLPTLTALSSDLSGDDSTQPFKTNVGHHANADPKIDDIAKEHPEHPAHPHSDNFKFADDDGSAHPGHATGKDKDISVQPSADPKIGDIAKGHPEHPAHPHSDVNQLASFKFADEGSAD